MNAIKFLLAASILASAGASSASTIQNYSLTYTQLNAATCCDSPPTTISGGGTGTATLDSSGVLTMSIMGETVLDVSPILGSAPGTYYFNTITSSTIALNTAGAYQLNKTGSTNTTTSCTNGMLDNVNSCATLALNSPAALFGSPAYYSAQSFSLAGGTINLKSNFGGVVVTTAYTLQAVPVPAAAWLLGSGLLGLTGLARQRKAT